MLTIDDINSINEKYKEIGFWYEVDLSQLIEKPNGFVQDCIKITKAREGGANGYRIHLPNNLFYMLHYFTQNGEIQSASTLYHSNVSGDYFFIEDNFNQEKLYLFLSASDMEDMPEEFRAYQYLIKPKNSLCVPVINGEFDDRFYIDVIGDEVISIKGYTINGVNVEKETDEGGDFLRLPSANDCIIGVRASEDTVFPVYKVTFKEFKTLPLLSIPMIYANNKQQIQLLNNETGEYITDFQAYYKGELLVDNMFNVPPLSEGENGYIPITIDLLDNRYPNCTLKMKSPIKFYKCISQQEVETALENGITYFGIENTTINGLELNNIHITFENSRFVNCVFNDCDLLIGAGSNYDDGNIFNYCKIYSTSTILMSLYGNYGNSIFNDCTIDNLQLRNYDLHFTGTINDCHIRNTLIISDGDIEITGTEFYSRQTRKSYFPAFLYLTGDYNVTGNSFRMTSTFTKLSFNMCLIKATNDFNVSEFIQQNNFELNITYDDEPTNTLYYNIVDDDKIRARRV